MEVATSRAATLIGSLGDYVELFGLPVSSNPAPKIDLPLGDLSRGDSTKNLQKT